MRKRIISIGLAICLLLGLTPGAWAAGLEVAAPSAILMDAATGTILWEKDAHTRLAPASVTKIMTLLLVLEALDSGKIALTDTVTCSEVAAGFGGSQIWLKPGEEMTVDDLLKAVAVQSANDATVCLAEYVAGSEEAFVQLMNQKAAELGMKNTHFTNATGLTDTEHYSSAADMAKLLQAALHNTTFRTIFTTEHYTTTATAQHPEGVSLTSTLLGKLDGTELPTGTRIEGGKTGYTAAAGLCLASLATVNGKEYILVTLAAPGDHGTEQYNIRDAVYVYRKLADKK